MKPKPNLKKQSENRKLEAETKEATAKIKETVQDAVRGQASLQDIKPGGYSLFFPDPPGQHSDSGMFDASVGFLMTSGGFALGMAVHALMGR